MLNTYDDKDYYLSFKSIAPATTIKTILVAVSGETVSAGLVFKTSKDDVFAPVNQLDKETLHLFKLTLAGFNAKSLPHTHATYR